MTQNTDYTASDLRALLAAIEAECQKIEGHTPGPWRWGVWDKNPAMSGTCFGHMLHHEDADGNSTFVADLFPPYLDDDERTPLWNYRSANLNMMIAAAHPDTGLLALHRLNKQHVKDHLAALHIAQTIGSTERTQYGLKIMGKDTARLWARYMGDTNELHH